MRLQGPLRRPKQTHAHTITPYTHPQRVGRAGEFCEWANRSCKRAKNGASATADRAKSRIYHIPILVGMLEVNFLTMRRQRHTGWQVAGTGTGGSRCGGCSSKRDPSLSVSVTQCRAKEEMRSGSRSAAALLPVTARQREEHKNTSTEKNQQSRHH